MNSIFIIRVEGIKLFKMKQLAFIESNYFTACAVIEKGVIIKAAPIIKYMVGKDVAYIKNYCNKKKWKINFSRIFV